MKSSIIIRKKKKKEVTVIEMTVTYLMPSTSIVSLAESACVKATVHVHRISLDICKYVHLYGRVDERYKKPGLWPVQRGLFLQAHLCEEVPFAS